MYSVMSYGHMAADGVRMDAYARAITRVVRPDSVVLDLGAGTGILSLLAARVGARKVHAVDTNPAVLLLRELAAENGLGDRIEVHHQSSFELTLPSRVDVVVSDLRGGTPLNGEHFALVRDARERLLRPEGLLLPTQDRLMVAAVESARLTRNLDLALSGFQRRGLDAESARVSMTNTIFPDTMGDLSASDMLSNAARWATIDYAAEQPKVIDGSVALNLGRAGRANALCVWFETTVLDGLDYSTAPGHSSVYARTLLPLLDPIDVSAGDEMRVTLRADARGERWAWDTTVVGADGAVKTTFRQATFLGTPTSAATLLRASTTFVPALNELGERTSQILEAMDGARTVGEIADRVAANSSSTRDTIVDEIRDLVGRYCR